MESPQEDPDSGASVGPKRSSFTANCCIAAYCFAFLVFGLQVALLGPTSSDFARALGIVEADLGLVYTVNGFISIVGAIPSGWVIDKLPGHAILAGSLGLQAAGFALMPGCRSLMGLTAAFVLVAFTWNFVNTAGNTFILWISREQQGSAMLINLVNAVFGAGSLAAPLVAELAGVTLGSSLAAYWLTAALTGLSATSFLLLPSPTNPHASSSSSGEAQEREEGAAGAPGVAPSWAGGGPLTLLLAALGLFVWIGVGTEVAFGNWVFTYTVQQLGLVERQGHFLNAAYWGAFTAGRMAASAAAVVAAPTTVLLCSMPLAVVGAGLAVVLPREVLAGADGAVMAVVAVLVGLGVSTAFANALSLLDEAAPVTGTVTGVLGGLAGAGCMIFPLVVALLAKHTNLGYQGLMWLTLTAFVALFMCLAAAVAVGRRLKCAAVITKGDISITLNGGSTDGYSHGAMGEQQQGLGEDRIPLLQAQYS